MQIAQESASHPFQFVGCLVCRDGVSDGGFFMDLNNKGYHDGMKWIASSSGMNASLHPKCAAAKGADKYLCMFAPHVSPFIETPIFALQAK